jgi:uncharacterized OB-fold protein
MAAVVYEQKIDLPYTYTAGAAQRAAIVGLREGRFVGSAAAGQVYVPARAFAPDGTRLSALVDVPDHGVLEAATTAHHRPGAPAYGLVRLEGAANVMLVRLVEGAEGLSPGAPVRAVWRAEREGSLNDVAFAPA